jgi:carboxylesterase type B
MPFFNNAKKTPLSFFSVNNFLSLDAFELKSPCAQITVFGPTPGLFAGSEDCLYLNIYSPALPAAAGRGVDRSALKPVMVWLHGGGFIEGSGAEYYPRALVEKEVIRHNI